MNREDLTPTEQERRRMEEPSGRLPFDRREWALTDREAQDCLRRQYGREVRGYADD